MNTHNCAKDHDDEVEDTHICILYQTGDKFFGYESVRSNRFYLVHDPKGATLSYLEDYHDSLKLMKNNDISITKHMFAGYQYMEATPKYEAKERFRKMGTLWKEMKDDDPMHTIHVELAHFNSHHTIHYLMRFLFPYADSIGFNEQEIFTLYNQFVFYKNREHQDEDDELEMGPSDSRLTVYESLSIMQQIISKFMEERYPNISRLQYHTLGHMITCYDPEKWDSAEDSLFRTGLTSAKYCMLHSKQDQQPR